jgi:hypothetical protein
LVPTITEASGASGGGGKGSSEDLLTLRELLIKAREETTKLQAEKDAVSRHSGVHKISGIKLFLVPVEIPQIIKGPGFPCHTIFSFSSLRHQPRTSS